MPTGWKKCTRCGWWQKSTGACVGCSYSSSSTKLPQPTSTPASSVPLTEGVLKLRWAEAKASASNPHHVKIERMCTFCLLRTVNSKPTCRGCQRALTECARILPGQWPPLSCPSSLLKKFGATPLAQLEEAGAPLPGPAPAPEKMETMEVETSPGQERPLLHLPVAQLKSEIARLERHLLDMPVEGFQALRDSLMAVKAELQARKPEGASLDKAIARQRQASKARQLAEEQVQESQAALERAHKALQIAQEGEQAANQEVQKMRTMIADAETTPEPKLTHEQLAQVGNLIGQPVAQVPPPPPMPAPQVQPGVATQLLTPTGEPLRHPQTVNAAVRQGRSPVGKRKLPPRTGEADYASTYREASRGASCTPDHGGRRSRSSSPRSTNAEHLPHPTYGGAAAYCCRPCGNANQLAGRCSCCGCAGYLGGAHPRWLDVCGQKRNSGAHFFGACWVFLVSFSPVPSSLILDASSYPWQFPDNACFGGFPFTRVIPTLYRYNMYIFWDCHCLYWVLSSSPPWKHIFPRSYSTAQLKAPVHLRNAPYELYSPPLIAQAFFWIWVASFLDRAIMLLLFGGFSPTKWPALLPSPIRGSKGQLLSPLLRHLLFLLVRGESVATRASLAQSGGRNQELRGLHPHASGAPASLSEAQRSPPGSRLMHPLRGVRVGEAAVPGPSASQATTQEPPPQTLRLRLNLHHANSAVARCQGTGIIFMRLS